MALEITTFNIIIASFGTWATGFALFSHILKDRYYLSEALLSFLAGAFYVLVLHLLGLQDYVQFAENASSVSLDFSRIVLGVQLVLAGVQLPAGYLRTEIKSLGVLLGPGMASMWTCSSLSIWWLVPNIKVLYAMAIAACVTPTDPVLSDCIVKVAESGANDGLGYPFLFFALYIIQYTGGDGSVDAGGGLWKAAGQFLGETCGFVVLLSIIYGWCVGTAARRLLRWAKTNNLIDRESFLVFAILMAMLISGTCGMVGSDDVLACFVAGNALTDDDWFRLETLEDSVQPTVDMVMNMAIFMWLGAACPWAKFWHNDVISFPGLMALACLVLLVRRLPIILSMHKHIRQIENVSQAAFMGYFGPIGVSAIFYLYVGVNFLRTELSGDDLRPEAEQLEEAMTVVVWFLVTCSVVNNSWFDGTTAELLGAAVDETQ
ncbi:hypothetical protein NLG97_g755 [Lecanicillium saksenae]|uniref:Uncharacterized protein n=1 Tax=Lecanicillium saksenae TaxID=468837 RepID=A0ACC1R9S5_9HYPO|nr:hypothetical protein NLG97_g755 [Lecanicillium saksenae]